MALSPQIRGLLGARNNQALNQQLYALASGLLNYNPRVPQSLGRSVGRGFGALARTPGPDPLASQLVGTQIQGLQQQQAGPTPGQKLAAETRLKSAQIRAGKPTGRSLQYKMLIESGVTPNLARGIAAGRYAVSRNPQDQSVDIVDKGTGKVIFGGPEATRVADAASALPKDVDYSQGTGASGLFGSMLNTFTDLFSGKLAAPETEKAVQGLTNLSVRTQTALQDAVPGRPSNYLMQKLEQLVVEPKSLTMGDARSKERLTQTRDMIATELNRIETDILGQKGKFSRKEMNAARANASELKGILADYDVVVSSFERAGGGIRPEVQERMKKYQ